MRRTSKLLLSLLTLSMLCSCGVRSTDTGKTPEKDVEVATGSAITAVFKNSDTTEKTAPLENDFIRIDDGDDDWVLANLDGTEKQEIKIEDEDIDIRIRWLTNDWLYYIDDVSYDISYDDPISGTICRIPVDCETQPKLDWEHKEILVKDTCYPEELMVTDSYIFYCGYDLETASAHGYRYDFNTKENTLVFKAKYEICEIVSDFNQLPIVVGDDFILVGDDRLYAVSLDTLEYKTIATDDDGLMDESILTEYGGGLYFAEGISDNIFKYDGDNTSCLTTEKAFHKAVKGMDLVDKNASDIDIGITDITIIDDRLYATVDIEWVSKEKYVEGPHKGETVRNGHERFVLLSTDINDCSEWTLDDTLAEYMLNNFERDMYAYDACGLSLHEDNYSTPYKTDAKDTVALLSIEEMFFTDDKSQVDIWSEDADGEYVHYYYDITTGKVQNPDGDVD